MPGRGAALVFGRGAEGRRAVGVLRDDGERGWFIVKAIAAVLVATVIGLVLDGFGVSFGGYVVLAAVLVFVLVVYVVPWLPTRR